MPARKIILGFGFAVVPLLVHYGSEAFHPSVPTPEVRRLRQREERSTGDEKVQLRDPPERPRRRAPRGGGEAPPPPT